MANMSCFSKRDNKTKHLQRTNEAHCSNFVKHRIAKAKKLQKTMSLICDNEASPPKEIHPFFLNSCHNNSDDNSSDEEINGKMRAGKEPLSFKTNEKSTTDKNIKNDVKNKKGSYRNIRKQKTKNKGSDSSGSEQKTHEKHADNMKKRHVVSKSIQEGLSKDDADSSSGKEFQKSKLSSMNLNAVIKLTQAREEHVMSTDSNSGSVTQIDKKTKISKEQSLRFKTHVVKILNRFKEVCSEYELKMEHVKWKHFKKELIHQESAANVIKRSKNVITILKTKLEAQEKELTNFYEEWYKNCSLENSDTEGSSLSEIESLHKTEDKEESDKSENILSAACIVSACDSDEIFSGSEEFILKRNTEKNKKNDLSLVEESPTKLIDSDNDNRNRAASPILGSNKNKEIHDKVNVRDNSNVLDSLSQPETCKSPENECIGNESLDDIFDENLAESTDITNNAKENKDNCESETTLKQMEIKESKINEDENKLETEALKQNLNSTDSDTDKVESLESVETKSIPFTEKSKTLKKDESNSSDDSEAEQKAKRTMLESDSETMNEDSPVQKSTKKSLDSKLKEKSNARSKTVKRSEEEKKSRKAEGGLTFDDSSSNEQDELSEVEACAKTALLDLNSDDSMSSDESENCIDKMNDSDDSGEDTLAKEKLLVSSNSESSSSENGGCNKLRAAKTDSISKKSKKDSLIEIMSTDCKEHGSSSKIGRTGSDKKLEMQPEIVLVRLSETVLEKYKNALDKSRQYLESKEIRSLVDLNRLQRSNRSMSSPQSSMFRRKSKVAKEKEDTLLNHLQEGEMGEGFVTRTEEDLNLENDIPTVTESSTIQTNEELMREADTATKKFLLNMSDSDIEEPKDTSENNDSEGDKDKTKSKTTTKQANMKSEEKDKDNADSNYKENEDKREKTKWRRNKLLTTKFSSSPSSSDDDSNIGKGKEGLGIRLKELQEKEEENIELPAGKDELLKSKRRRRKKILDSDSDVQLLESNPESDNSVILENKSSSNSDSSVGKQKKMRKRKSRKSSDTDSSFTEKRSKPKRKRIKTMSSDSDNSDSDQVSNSQGTPGKKGRKNIRKVMKDKQVADDTKQAAKEEEERIMRIAERQKLYNEMYEARLAGEEKVDKLVLDFNPETKEELVSVDENLVKRLKPHQAKGIKFMWDACFESLERTKSSSGSGCIIAHCMGLGKTLQVISLVYTLLTHEETNVKTIMIVCPLSTVLNWLNEFKLWLKDIDNDIEVYEMTKMKKNIERKCQLESWQRTGGVLIIGYEMFRNLSGTNNRMKKTMKEKILQCLIDPGPDVIVCDEGHLLKNEDTALSKSMKQVKTLRRIVLTGTPLQNNLTEYHCMVQFVKPNLLGTRREFLNRFANPITNGQFDDSTEYDVKLMKKRAYVLHKMLKGCVQRFDYSVLTPFLPPKQEYVIFVRLTEVQINMYRHYLDNFARRTRTASGSLFADFQALQRIWTHPIVLKLNAEKMEKINERKFSSSDSEGSLKDFINDDSDSASSSNTASSNDDDDDVQSIDSAAGTRSTRSNPKNIKSEVEIVSKPDELEKKEEEWWAQFTKPEHFEDMKVSAKLLLLFGILRECEQIGDKVLVFSQSLYSLSLIEQFLRKIDNETENGENSENIDGHSGSWSLGLDYFRLDGQTSAENRNIWCKIFNQPSNTRARLFLISTRAGGLGINLTAANRVIIFDASWNPSHDVQSIFRIYRFGQKKPCYVYRFLAAGTMEEKIYNRQVTKLSLSCRVVDEQQIERHYSNNDLSELYKFEPNTTEVRSTLNLPKDRLLAEIFLKYKDFVENYHEHDSLLENKAEEELNEEERKQAWLEYEEEKKGKPPPMLVQYPTMTAIPNHLLLNQYNIPSTFNISTDYEKLRELLQKDYPNATPETQQMMTTRVLTDMYNYWERQAYKNVAGHINQNAAINQVQMRSQIPNLTRMPYMVPNMSQTLSNPQTTYRAPDIRPSEPDDDVVEVSSSTVNNKTTNQEE